MRLLRSILFSFAAGLAGEAGKAGANTHSLTGAHGVVFSKVSA